MFYLQKFEQIWEGVFFQCSRYKSKTVIWNPLVLIFFCIHFIPLILRANVRHKHYDVRNFSF